MFIHVSNMTPGETSRSTQAVGAGETPKNGSFGGFSLSGAGAGLRAVILGLGFRV